MSNSKAPHKAVVRLDISIHEVLKTGECSGAIMPLEELQKYGFNSNIISVVVNGKDKYACLKNLIDKIQDFHDGD